MVGPHHTHPQSHPIPYLHTHTHTYILYILYIHHPITDPHTPPPPYQTRCVIVPFFHAHYSNLAQPSPAQPGPSTAWRTTISFPRPSPSPSPLPSPPLHDLHLAPITSSCYAPTYQKRLPACEPTTTTCDLPLRSLHKYCTVLFYVDAASAVLRYIHTVLPAQSSWPTSPRQPPCVPGQLQVQVQDILNLKSESMLTLPPPPSYTL
jgi:hypothetical protein